MKLIGRIMLLVVCCLMGYSAVMTGIDCFTIFKENDWTNFANIGDMLRVGGTFLMQFVTMVFALVGVVAALKGRATLKLTLLSFILLINVVLTFMNAFSGGAEFDFMKVLNISISCIYPIGYVIGSFLIRF